MLFDHGILLMYDPQYHVVVMEVSNRHALALNAYGIEWYAAVFTNLTQILSFPQDSGKLSGIKLFQNISVSMSTLKDNEPPLSVSADPYAEESLKPAVAGFGLWCEKAV